MVLAALPGALVLPGAWAWRSAARPALWRDLLFVAIPFANAPITGVLAWLLGVLFGPRGGVVAHGGGLFGTIFLSILACVEFAPILLPVGVLTAAVVRVFSSRRPAFQRGGKGAMFLGVEKR